MLVLSVVCIALGNKGDWVLNKEGIKVASVWYCTILFTNIGLDVKNRMGCRWVHLDRWWRSPLAS
jgi:hypothetical protein